MEKELCIALRLGYNGAAYSGFAKQKDPDVDTVQGRIENALRTLYRRPVETVCAGRTDAGVHARGQVVSFAVSSDENSARNLHQLRVSLNALTPNDISIQEAFEVPEGFSARFNAKWREYRYRICTGPVPPLFLQDFAWWHKGQLDMTAMTEAAQYLEGEHDFKSFCKSASAVGKNTVRCIHSIEVSEEDQMGERCIVIRVIGNAFLHSMVRTIVGTLAEVGEGRRKPEWVAEVLNSCNRNAAGSNAPACGLTFWHVEYNEL